MNLVKNRELIFSKQNGIGTIELNRVQKMNALNTVLLKDLYELLCSIETDNEVRVVVLKGSGNKAFAAGADLEEIHNKNNGFDRREYLLLFSRLYDKMLGLDKPIIAAVNGYAFGGGCLLALYCDIIIATSKSQFGQQEVNYGFMGGGGLLPKLIGRQKAAELIMIGSIFDAQEAYRLNLINKVVDEAKLEDEVQNICRKLAAKSPESLKMIKKVIKMSLETGLSNANLYESEVSCLCLDTESSKTAMGKFITK